MGHISGNPNPSWPQARADRMLAAKNFPEKQTQVISKLLSNIEPQPKPSDPETQNKANNLN
jgi:hypothetical protein